MMLDWISEEDMLPNIAENVLLLTPRQGGGWWDARIARILVRYEGVAPYPVRKGDVWPVDYYWNYGTQQQTCLVTGNAYWARLNRINLPPGAEHYQDQHSHAIKQAEGLEYAVPTRSASSNQERDSST